MRISDWSSDVCSSELVALEQLGREAPGTVLRHPQLQLADTRHQRARVMPRTVAEPRIAALALARAQRLVPTGFQHSLHHAAHNLATRLRPLHQQLFDRGYRNLNLWSGHRVCPRGRWKATARHQTPP